MMAFGQLIKFAKRRALELARREIDRILEKANAVPGVEAEASDAGVVLKGKKLKKRTVSDPLVRDISR